jgi:cyclohexanecarboxylate-CoA ligase
MRPTRLATLAAVASRASSDASAGAGEAPTLDRLLEHSGREGTAVVDGQARLTRSGVRAEAASLAGGLRARGVGRGDVVAWQLPNWHEAVALFHACWLLGAVAAPLHHRSGEREVADQLALLAPRCLLAAPGLPARRAAGAIEVRGSGTAGDAGHRGDAGCKGLVEHPPVSGGAASLDDRAVVLFTSGSDDRPKGVVHTHRSLGHKARTMPGVHGLSGRDVVLMPAPLAHVSGLLNGVLLPAAVGMTVVLMERWDPAEALELIEVEGVSFMVGPPTFFLELVDAPAFTPERVASLRVVSCGGTDVTPAFVEHATARLGARVKRSYGSTEAPTVATWHQGDPPDRAATTDGRAVGDVELRVTAPGTGAATPTGAPGELWVRGTEVFAGYVGTEPGGTFTPEGWFATGDLAAIDDEGWLTVVGRRRDVIIRGGENVAPAEVEAALEAHPAVRQAVAVGLPDDRLGEVVAAAVVADRPFDLAACRAWFAERGMARFKAPAHLLRVDELPRLGSGKPDRRAARALLVSAVENRERIVTATPVASPTTRP